MKIIDRITEALGLYDEEEIYDDVPEKEPSPAPSRQRSSSLLKSNEVKEEAPKKNYSLFRKKQQAASEPMGSKTIALPLADKQVKVVVLEPTSFDDSQKIADYLRNKQPVVVNFEGTDSVITKRMTDFISGTIYALGGSMKKIGRSILVCAPKNVDIDAGASIYDDKGRQPWEKD